MLKDDSISNSPTSYVVTLVNNGASVLDFDCPENLSIFRAAARAGIEMSAGCMQGRCQICRSELLSGQVKSTRPISKYATVDPAALPDGYILPCSVSPLSDTTLAPRGPWRIVKPSGQFTWLNERDMPVWD